MDKHTGTITKVYSDNGFDFFFEYEKGRYWEIFEADDAPLNKEVTIILTYNKTFVTVL